VSRPQLGDRTCKVLLDGYNQMEQGWIPQTVPIRFSLEVRPRLPSGITPGVARLSLDLGKLLQHLNWHGNDVGAPPSRRDPYRTGRKLHGPFKSSTGAPEEP
jgi:hypothetical protein